MHRLALRPSLFAASAALLVALAACSDSTGSRAGAAARMDVVGGNAQTGAPGAELAQPVVVKVTDAKGRAVKGQVVNFVVTAGGGTVFAGTAITNDEGVAQERWTVGKVVGSPQTLEARAVDSSTGQALVFATFTATVTPGTPAIIEAVDGRTQTAGATGGPVAHPLAVLVTDAHGNPVPGVTVNWFVGAGNGTFAQPTSTTSAQGVAAAPVWTLGDGSRSTENAAASVQGVGQVVFTALVGTVLQKIFGDARVGAAGTVVDVAVRLDGQAGPVAGVPVTWTVAGGGGTVQAHTPPNPLQGYAYARWTLGPAQGTQTLTARAGALTATFTATALATATRTQIAQVPGRVLDATRERVLWLDSAGVRQVKIRTLATGADVVVKADTLVNGVSFVTGHLFTGGTLVRGSGDNWFEWRNGTLTHLGAVGFSASLDGNWAAWRLEGSFVRRDLAAGTSTLLNVNAIQFDVGPDGDLAWFSGNELFLYENGTTTPLGPPATSSFPTGPMGVVTDGIHVGYLTGNVAASTINLFLDRPGGDLHLQSGSTFRGPPLHFAFEGGWIAYGSNTLVNRRSPAGTVQRVDSDALPGTLRALAPDGSVLYTSGSPMQLFLVTPTGETKHAGEPDYTRVVVRDGRFLLITGGRVEEITT